MTSLQPAASNPPVIGCAHQHRPAPRMKGRNAYLQELCTERGHADHRRAEPQIAIVVLDVRKVSLDQIFNAGVRIVVDGRGLFQSIRRMPRRSRFETYSGIRDSSIPIPRPSIVRSPPGTPLLSLPLKSVTVSAAYSLLATDLRIQASSGVICEIIQRTPDALASRWRGPST
jgi:hypothetical protein